MTNPRNSIQRNLGLIEETPSEQLCAWLKLALEGASNHPFALTPEPSVPVQLQAVYDRLTHDGQRKLASCIVDLLDSWRSAAGVKLLRELLRLSAFIRLIPAAASIQALLQGDRITEPLDQDAEALAVSVLSGLAPARDALTAMRALYHQQRYHQEAGAQLMIGLCVCEPDRYPEHLEYFLTYVYPKRSSYYDLRDILAELVSVISPGALTALLHELSPEHHRVVTTLLHGTVGVWSFRSTHHVFLTETGASVYRPRRLSDTTDMCRIADDAFDEDEFASRLQNNGRRY